MADIGFTDSAPGRSYAISKLTSQQTNTRNAGRGSATIPAAAIATRPVTPTYIAPQYPPMAGATVPQIKTIIKDNTPLSSVLKSGNNAGDLPIDMNGQKVTNLPLATEPTDAVGLNQTIDIANLSGGGGLAQVLLINNDASNRSMTNLGSINANGTLTVPAVNATTSLTTPTANATTVNSTTVTNSGNLTSATGTITTLTSTTGNVTTLNSTTINNSGNLSLTGVASTITVPIVNATTSLTTPTANTTTINNTGNVTLSGAASALTLTGATSTLTLSGASSVLTSPTVGTSLVRESVTGNGINMFSGSGAAGTVITYEVSGTRTDAVLTVLKTITLSTQSSYFITLTGGYYCTAGAGINGSGSYYRLSRLSSFAAALVDVTNVSFSDVGGVVFEIAQTAATTLVVRVQGVAGHTINFRGTIQLVRAF